MKVGSIRAEMGAISTLMMMVDDAPRAVHLSTTIEWAVLKQSGFVEKLDETNYILTDAGRTYLHTIRLLLRGYADG